MESVKFFLCSYHDNSFFCIYRHFIGVLRHYSCLLQPQMSTLYSGLKLLIPSPRLAYPDTAKTPIYNAVLHNIALICKTLPNKM